MKDLPSDEVVFLLLVYTMKKQTSSQRKIMEFHATLM